MKLTRRQVLRGMGGFTVALPFLPSLLSSDEARAAGTAAPRRFIALRSEHGGVLGSNMYPSNATLTEAQNYAGYQVRRGALAASQSGSTSALSPVLTASSTTLTPSLVAKLNVLRGLDLPFYIGHHGGGSLGNYGDLADKDMEYRPTCDQVLAWSPKFYPSLSTILMRSVVVGFQGMSWGYPNPQVQDPTTLQPLFAEISSKTLFSQLYSGPSTQPQPTRPPIIDRVLEDYKRLRNGNRRLSGGDRQRLDEHIARLEEIERRLKVQVSCQDVQPPTQDSGALLVGPNFLRNIPQHIEYWKLMNDVLVASLACDTSRVVTLMAADLFGGAGATGWFADTPLEWHQEVAHNSHQPDRQAMMTAMQQHFFEHVFLDLAMKLDAVQEPNGTLLDSCLMFWVQESGPYTHDPISMPVVTAGSACGWLKTGSYVDYGNPNVTCHSGGEVTHAGLLYNQFLGTAMQAMGLSPADYESVPGGGYGLHFPSTDPFFAGHQKHSAAVVQAAGEPLPFLKA